MTTRAQLISQAVHILQAAHTPQPQAEAEFLLAAAQGVARTHILAFGTQDVLPKDAQKFWNFIEQKKQGQPVAYITGEADFGGLVLRSDSRALVPRPETEELAQYCAKLFERGADPDVLDMCTGSGCIALYLAAQFPRARIVGVDISEQALQLAAENARLTKLQEHVQWLQSDLFEQVSGCFDLIVSNPPYIPTRELTGLSVEVHQEPRLALDGGNDGLDLVRKIISLAADYLNPKGTLALEIGLGEAEAVSKLFDSARWEGGIKKDFAGIDRFIFARLKN